MFNCRPFEGIQGFVQHFAVQIDKKPKERMKMKKLQQRKILIKESLEGD
ncbi:hypothetical protein G159_12920 [Planococcus glaciei CHR43]|nr:hypothetical protein G159_12920 [Planococcus glaciei CHR43]